MPTRDPKTPEFRALRAAIAVTGVIDRRPRLRRALPAAVWLSALGLTVAGCDHCVPTWGPSAPPRGPDAEPAA